MIIRSLEQTPLPEIIKTFNESFVGYFVTIKLNQDQLIQKMALENIRLQHSAGAFIDNQLVGLILSGIDEFDGQKTGYNGGTGVLPAYRGKGITSQLYDYLIKHYKKEGVKLALLEVINENTTAIHSYEKSGFKIRRQLDCVKGQLKYEKPEVSLNIIARQIKYPDWDGFSKYWNWYPTWPNTISSIRRGSAVLQLLGLYEEDQLRAYGVINTQTGRIVQFATHPEYRRKGLGKLLFYYLGKLGNPKLSIINLDETDQGTLGFLKKIGFTSYIKQYEMGLEL